MKNYKILLTGHTKGIGNNTLKLLLQHQYSVTAIARKTCHINHKCLTELTGDLSNQENIKKICNRLDGENFNCIILNAGYNDIKPAESYSVEEIFNIINVNFAAHAAIIRATIPGLLKNKGKIIGVGSYSALETARWNNYYGASKAAFHHLLRNVFEQYRKEGLQVTNIIPDITASNFYDHQQFEPDVDENSYIETASIAELIFNLIDKPQPFVTLEMLVRPQKFALKRKKS